ncbi:MAG: hypothetical protein QOJ07_1875 [Thermoleophilaceae bacterium]|nr:hypothetical protein [Thermoleophilaceae bacterium]
MPAVAAATSEHSHATDALPPTPADAAHVLGLIGGYQLSQAVYVAARLRLADLIAAGECTTEGLARRTGAVPDRLHRLLRSLSAHGVFTQTGDDAWGMTPAAQTLRSDAPGSLHSMALMWNEEHYEAFANLTDAVLGERSAFEHRFGTDWWSYLAEHPDSSATFNAAMANLGRQVHAAAAGAADLSGVDHLVDVGGGAGALTAGLLERHPGLAATLVDLPHVLPAADDLLTGRGARPRHALPR